MNGTPPLENAVQQVRKVTPRILRVLVFELFGLQSIPALEREDTNFRRIEFNPPHETRKEVKAWAKDASHFGVMH